MYGPIETQSAEIRDSRAWPWTERGPSSSWSASVQPFLWDEPTGRFFLSGGGPVRPVA